MNKHRQGSHISDELLQFSFDGRVFPAQRGDTAASALLAQGEKVIARSVKYGRPRGLVCAGMEEPNGLLTVAEGPALLSNIPAPLLELTEGLQLFSQNRWPSLRWDLTAVRGLAAPVLHAGFYYKTFKWPGWRFYEPMIRKLAGLGPAPTADLPVANIEHIDCDVCIAGAGAAGLAAAMAAARLGVRVVICEREPVCGGELDFETSRIDGLTGHQWVNRVVGSFVALKVRVLNSTSVVSHSGSTVIAHRHPRGLPYDHAVYRIRARAYLHAAGAIERPIAFANNDRPGVMLLGAAERYGTRYGVVAGHRPILFGNHNRLYAAAERLLGAGIKPVAIIDTRTDASIGFDRVSLQKAGVYCYSHHQVIRAHGRLCIRAVEISPIGGTGASQALSCDALLVSGGWDTTMTKEAPDTALQDPGSQQWREYCGAAYGALTLADAIIDGHAKGITAANFCERRAPHALPAGPIESPPAPISCGDAYPNAEPFLRSAATEADEKRQFVDLQNDVTVADLRQAVAEGFAHIEHIKRYTTLGIGTEQGQMSKMLGAEIAATFVPTQKIAPAPSRRRPPYEPATLATLAGYRRDLALRPERRTALHEWHESHGGVMESMGLWSRPRYYNTNGSHAETAGIAEAARVREVGGILDASTLGKIEVCGVDAARFLDRLYLTRASTIPAGRSRYMVLLREDGMVLDDGIVLRIDNDRFVATVSTGHTEEVLSHFEFYQASEFANSKVAIADVTVASSVIAVAGPRSTDALIDVFGGEWTSAIRNLKHMDFVQGEWQGGPLRVLRASFSGERAYEIHCRHAAACRLWRSLVDQGLPPYGTEALDILRVEKGYLVSSEMNGQATPLDLGMDGMLKRHNDCVGIELLRRPALREPNRPKLVGFRASDSRSRFSAGAQVTVDLQNRSCGHVTSVVFSPMLNEWVGLGFLARDLPERAPIMARDPLRGRNTELRVTQCAHFDPTGERMK